MEEGEAVDRGQRAGRHPTACSVKDASVCCWGCCVARNALPLGQPCVSHSRRCKWQALAAKTISVSHKITTLNRKEVKQLFLLLKV